MSCSLGLLVSYGGGSSSSVGGGDRQTGFDANFDGMDDLHLQYDNGGERRWQARLSNGTAFDVNGDWTTTTTPDVEAILTR